MEGFVIGNEDAEFMRVEIRDLEQRERGFYREVKRRKMVVYVCREPHNDINSVFGALKVTRR